LSEIHTKILTMKKADPVMQAAAMHLDLYTIPSVLYLREHTDR